MEARDIIRLGLSNAQRSVNRTLEGLTPEELRWQARPDANSIGLILFHMSRSEDSFVHKFILGQPQLWEREKWHERLGKAASDSGAHYTPAEVAAFAVPPLIEMQAYAEAVRKETLAYLEKATASEMDRRVELPQTGRLPFEPVVGVLLTFTVTHLAQHAGEISYLRGLQRGMDK
jgi:uncharacterized damage-inducible protein DinB